MPRKGTGRFEELLKDPDVRRWHDNAARGSENTADSYLRDLGYFLRHVQLGPHEYAALPARERDDLMVDFVTWQAKKRLSGATMKRRKASVASWLEWNGAKYGRKIKVPDAQVRTRAAKSRIPTADVLRAVLNVADAREKAAITLVAHAGLRPEVLGDYQGLDGLRLGDFPEARLDATGIVFDQVPTRIDVPASLSKTGTGWCTFLGHEGCEYVQAMVRERMEAGEKLTADSAIIRSQNPAKPFMESKRISSIMRRPMRAAGVQEPPYIWRSYFGNRCMMAQAKGLLFEWKEFFMGHKGDISFVYALHKQLPPDTVEAMRKAYSEALSYLEARPKVDEADPMRKIAESMLRAAGTSAEEVERLDLDAMDSEAIVKVLTDGLAKRMGAVTPAGTPKVRQRIVEVGQLGALLEQGWTFRASVEGGKAIVETAG